MSDKTKIDQGTLIPITSKDPEQAPEIEKVVKDALSILRTKKIKAFALTAIIDCDDGEEAQTILVGKINSFHERAVVGMIEEMKFCYQHGVESGG